jgi:glycerol uptake facilitator protein
VLGEFTGTCLIVFVGCAVVATDVTTGGQLGLVAVAATWGLAVIAAVILTGGHLNPAVTISLAVWRGFPKRHIAPYISAQMVGAFVGAALVYLLMGGAIAEHERQHAIARGQPGSEASAKVFGEYFTVPATTAFGVEAAATGVLLLVVGATGRLRSRYVVAACIGLTIAVLIYLVGPLTMACFNPARDLAPRVFSALAGWGTVPFHANGTGWFTVYVLAPIVGGLAGGAVSVVVSRA